MTHRLSDILAKGLTIVFCGINPALSAANSGHHFVNGTNRFWRVLNLAGFTPVQIRPEDDRSILKYGYGLTAVVDRPTRRAGEVSRVEFAAAATGFQRKIKRFSPRAIAFLGKSGYSGMTQFDGVKWGHQDEPFAGADVWVLPNPSGLNRAFNLQALVAAYQEMRVALSGKTHASRR